MRDRGSYGARAQSFWESSSHFWESPSHLKELRVCRSGSDVALAPSMVSNRCLWRVLILDWLIPEPLLPAVIAGHMPCTFSKTILEDIDSMSRTLLSIREHSTGSEATALADCSSVVWCRGRLAPLHRLLFFEEAGGRGVGAFSAAS